MNPVIANIKMSSIYLLVTSIIYFLISKLIFDSVYQTTTSVVDEEFHLPLGLAYCKYNFNKWDPKVTTLPGLYLLTSLFLGPSEQCNVYALRMINLVGSVINFYLIYFIIRLYNEEPDWRNIFSTINIAILPPLYFFSFVYYTDVWSLTMVLFMVLFHEKKYHCFAAIFGLFGTLMRQSNIIYVAMLLVKMVLVQMYVITKANSRRKSYGSDLPKNHLLPFLITMKDNWALTMRRAPISFWCNFSCYMSVLSLFVSFVIINKGIVVGDRSAHQPTLHIPQIFYFSLFSLIFAWPYYLGELSRFFQFVGRHPGFISFLFVTMSSLVYYNTLVHPYMLADNRHYLFYIWKRFYEKFTILRYGAIMPYIYGFYVIFNNLFTRYDVSFGLVYIPCVTFLLVTQKLIEFRYFFIPYVLLRMKFKNFPTNYLVLEFLTHLILNSLVFNTFFNKTIKWNQYSQPQRLAW